MRHCEVRDGLLVMKMSSILFCLVGVVIICSVWVVISMSKKRLLMSEGYECPCMVQSGQLMSPQPCPHSDTRLPDLEPTTNP